MFSRKMANTHRTRFLATVYLGCARSKKIAKKNCNRNSYVLNKSTQSNPPNSCYFRQLVFWKRKFMQTLQILHFLYILFGILEPENRGVAKLLGRNKCDPRSWKWGYYWSLTCYAQSFFGLFWCNSSSSKKIKACYFIRSYSLYPLWILWGFQNSHTFN